MPGVNPMYLVIMKNLLQIHKGNRMMCIFDMKGSTYKRQAADVENLDDKVEGTDQNILTTSTTMSAISTKDLDFPFYLKKFLKNNTKVLKDLDYVKLCKIHQSIFGLNITYYERKQLMEILERDTEFLRDNDLMDYSILIGIEQILHQKEIENIDDSILES